MSGAIMTIKIVLNSLYFESQKLPMKFIRYGETGGVL